MEYDLELVYTMRFDEFTLEKLADRKNVELLHRMRAVPPSGKLSDDEWDILCKRAAVRTINVQALYSVMAFRKRADAKFEVKPTSSAFVRPTDASSIVYFE
jgi:hypothetical protein